MEKKKVLFVDDEVNVLSALRRMLRSLRKEMELFFAESGAEALELFDEHQFNVVISDMRMPGMDGAQLLALIKERSPATVRIILSGEADIESVCRTVGVTHQFLAKPCEGAVVINIVRRACALHSILVGESIKSIVASIHSLPSLPAIYDEVQAALQQPDVSADQIGKIIEGDIAMTAKILQLVNSSFFALCQRVETPARAVKLLGIDTIKVLVLGVEIFDQFHFQRQGYSPQSLWSHSLMVANCARLIAEAETEDLDFINSCFVAGLLHDIGKLVLLAKLEKQYVQVLQLMEEENLSSGEAERRVFGTTHACVGAYLVGLWGFSSDVLEAIAYQNESDFDQLGRLGPPLVVYVANLICKKHEMAGMETGHPVEFDLDFFNRVGLGERLVRWEELCNQYLAEQPAQQDQTD